MLLKNALSPVLMLLALYTAAKAQESRTLSDCELSFRNNNLQMLAAAYDINQAKAAVIQARIWEQPFLSGEMNALNPQRQHYFDVGSKGQKAIALNQLIYLGGKKRNEIAFAKSNERLAELQFSQLLNTLKLKLRNGFYSLYFHQQTVHRLEIQVSNLDTLVAAYARQSERQNVSLRELVRLQALSLQFKKDLLDVRQQINEEQAQLQLLTGDSAWIVPALDSTQLEMRLRQLTIRSEQELFQSLLSNNPEYQYAAALNENSEWMLRWQKSLATPDITLGTAYDQRGGAFNNQLNLTLGMPLPLWNKNKGNILTARAELEQSKINKELKAAELRNALHTEYLGWTQLRKEYISFADSGRSNYFLVYSGMLSNFQKRNISLLDFTDFMESYNQSLLSINEIQLRIIRAQESMNMLTGISLFE